MQFNEKWNKAKNDQLRKMNRDGKSKDFIINYFGENLKYDPKNRFAYGMSGIFSYSEFIKLNEIKITPKEIEYETKVVKSNFIKGKNDYVNYFTVNKHEYIIRYFYYILNDIESYQLLFTTAKQYNFYLIEMNKLKKSGNFTETDYINLQNIVEKETNFNDIMNIMKAISYILLDFYPSVSNLPLSLGETNNPVKIELYRNVIRNSFPHIIETNDLDFNGK